MPHVLLIYFFISLCIFSICSLINKLKPGIIKRINRRSTPIAGLVSDTSPVFCCFTIISWTSGVTEVYTESNHLLYRKKNCFVFFYDYDFSSYISESCWKWFYLLDTHANTVFIRASGCFWWRNCQICLKQQLEGINSDLPPRANDWNPAAGAQDAAAAEKQQLLWQWGWA